MEGNQEVPKYDELVIRDKSSDYCVIVFVINEGEKLHKQLSRMSLSNCEVDIIISDGGSTDNSTEIEKLKSLDVNTLLIKKGEGKLGSQMRIAFSWALKRGYKGVVSIDGNNKDSVENIKDFILKLESGFDHVQGSRFIEGGKAVNTPFSRLLGLKILHVPLIRLASGYPYTDTTNGFRAYSAKLLKSSDIAVFRRIFTGYELHYYLAIEAARRSFRCIEIPVSRIYPKGKVPTKISPVKGNLNVVKKLILSCIGYYRL